VGAETRTGGREATEGVIGGGTALAVGDPATATPAGFAWTALSEVARLETGHTPSRKHPEYWDGHIPWIGIKDATANHGRTILRTNQTVSQMGIENSSARVLPAGTVCLSRTASVGYVVVMGVPMSTSQDFVNWVCGPDIDNRYLKYVLQLERETLLRFASGTTHQTIYFPEAKAFHVLLPRVEEQRTIAGVLGVLDDKIESNRRRAEVAESLLDVLAAASVGSELVALRELVEVDRVSCTPASSGETLIDHFSLPAFDSRRLPERTTGTSIKSNKLVVRAESVLLSRLNPGTNRTWFAVPSPGVLAAASTEFMVLRPASGVSLGGLWLAVRDECFRTELARRATGTSGSHQRVRPDDVLSMEVPDVRLLAAEAAGEAEELMRLVHQARTESAMLASLRDVLLPELLSGRLRVPITDEPAGAVT
jgi:type I restriction enzyme S subunit